MRQTQFARVVLLLILVSRPAWAQRIRVDPVGVNVNSTGATTVFLTYGGVANYRPAEAFWCGELIPATPDAGFKCDPATIFGSLPARYNLSTPSGAGAFTDIMSIPPSVARRAYQAALSGNPNSEFFYVRRFINLLGGPDEYVVVTCRMTEGGARSPFSLTEVLLSFAVDTPVLFVQRREKMPAFKAEISYNGTGRLKGRWEVVLPGDEMPEARDLLTEASLPIERRGTQRGYTEIGRFNVFLPPSGRTVLDGPDPSRLPTAADGPYLILLRIEASDDREGDSNLKAVGAGPGVVHSGAVAGFPMPVLRYYIGGNPAHMPVGGKLALLEPADLTVIKPGQRITLSWTEIESAALVRVEMDDEQSRQILAALLRPGVGIYRLPPWLGEKAGPGILKWRVVALDAEGSILQETNRRRLRFASAQP